MTAKEEEELPSVNQEWTQQTLCSRDVKRKSWSNTAGLAFSKLYQHCCGLTGASDPSTLIGHVPWLIDACLVPDYLGYHPQNKVLMKLSKSWGSRPAEKYHRSTLPGKLFSLFLRNRKAVSLLLILRTWYQSVLKDISPEYSLEGLMLTLKLQYFGHLRQRDDS